MFYKVVNDGVIVSLHQSTVQPPNGVQITSEKYQEILMTIRSKPEDTFENVHKLMDSSEQYEPFARTHEQIVEWYTMQVLAGEMTRDEIPEEYKAEVEVNLPEIPNNDFGVDNKTYNDVIDDYTMQLIGEGVL